MIDITGITLTPGNGGNDCLGNGEHYDRFGNLIPICCDECDYLICCTQKTISCEDCNESDCAGVRIKFSKAPLSKELSAKLTED